MKVCKEEIFGPVVTISPYQTFEDALRIVNDSRFGLQAGVFTNDINRAFEAHRTLDVGGLIVNDVSAVRADQMRSEEDTAELQSRQYLVCPLLLEKKKKEQLSHHIKSIYIL